ncbi:MAG TPA: T9SS type A sorting domain-containing protein, partial [Candidatus Sulfotelmatobacter sp.]|nr:T9SS type A sorting domain-containing protein [Candidatus Sulfotelmatobacter sp.]
ATHLRVTWNDADDTTGAGLQGAALYMRTEQGPFVQVGTVPSTSNSLDLSVTNGHTYGFYSLASDNAGNLEPSKTHAEATITVGSTGDVPVQKPAVTLLRQNYPNPFSGSTTLWFDLATTETVSLEVFDIQGRSIAKPLDGKLMQAGSYRIPLHSLSAGPGVYFYRLRAGRFEQSRKLVMLK